MNPSEYGVYGCPRPFVALFARTRPPGIDMPEEVPWPAMPVLATLPDILRIRAEKSRPFIVGADPLILVLAPL
jgi:hypothetical protein